MPNILQLYEAEALYLKSKFYKDQNGIVQPVQVFTVLLYTPTRPQLAATQEPNQRVPLLVVCDKVPNTLPLAAIYTLPDPETLYRLHTATGTHTIPVLVPSFKYTAGRPQFSRFVQVTHTKYTPPVATYRTCPKCRTIYLQHTTASECGCGCWLV